jgi:CDP-glucose 4,6-dehydratase
MPSSPSFWNKRRVLVTGHTGFKGSWLSLWLQMLGAEVVGYALPPPTQPNHFTLAGVGRQMTSLVGDVRDADAIDAVFARYRPEVVFHLAAQALVLPAYDDPAATFSTNVMGAVNLLDAVRRDGGVRAVLVVTSDKCYAGEALGGACRESDRLGGDDPYSSSKACAELVCTAYRASYFAAGATGQPVTALATARAGNAIGGGDWSGEAWQAG